MKFSGKFKWLRRIYQKKDVLIHESGHLYIFAYTFNVADLCFPGLAFIIGRCQSGD